MIASSLQLDQERSEKIDPHFHYCSPARYRESEGLRNEDRSADPKTWHKKMDTLTAEVIEELETFLTEEEMVDLNHRPRD